MSTAGSSEGPAIAWQSPPRTRVCMQTQNNLSSVRDFVANPAVPNKTSMNIFLFISLFLSMVSFWNESTNLSFTETTSMSGAHNLKLSRQPSLGDDIFVPTPSGLSSNEGYMSEGPTKISKVIGGGSFGSFFFILSFFFLTNELLSRWFFSKHLPLRNLYESFLFLNWSFIGIYLVLWWNAKISGPSRDDLENTFSPGVAPHVLTWVERRLIHTKPSTNSFKFLSPLLSSMVLFIQSFADWKLPNEMKEISPLVPALQSNWLLMHVSIMILRYAALFIGCILSIIYLGIVFARPYPGEACPRHGEAAVELGETPYSRIEFPFGETEPATMDMRSHDTQLGATQLGGEQHQRMTRFTKENSAVPSFSLWLATKAKSNSTGSNRDEILLQIDSLSYRSLSFGFPLLTLGILSGAVWANEAWGSYWSWDPKETWAFITWLFFAFYLHTRLQYNWEGKKSALVASFGFFIVWICYLGVNLLGQGLHRYGWIAGSA